MYNSYEEMELKKKKMIKRLIGAGIAGVISLNLIFSTVKVIPVNNVGVKYSNFKGTVSEQALPSGVIFKLPFTEKVTTVSTELRSADIDDIQVTTKDSQNALVDIEMQYRVVADDAIETFKQFRSTPEELWIHSFVYQRIQRGVQEAASDYSISELMGNKRGEFQVRVDEAVAKALEANHLTFHSASVDDIEISATLLDVIEESAKAKQRVETAKQEKTKQEVENETKIAKAKAESEVKEINAQAEAIANKKLSEGITPELVQYMEAQARIKHGWYKYNNMDPKVITNEE